MNDRGLSNTGFPFRRHMMLPAYQGGVKGMNEKTDLNFRGPHTWPCFHRLAKGYDLP